MKTRMFNYLVLFSFLLLMGNCSSSEGNIGKQYDPTQAIEIFDFSPDSAGMRTKCIVKGRNFGLDINKIQVLFAGDRKARVISSSGDMIYCLIPKQPGGETNIAVVVEDDTCVFEKRKFLYSVKQLISTTCGKNDNGGYADGTLTDSRFAWTCGIAYLAGDNLLISERFDWRVRMASLNDNKVITLIPGFPAGKAAVTKDKKNAYLVQHGAPHLIYRVSQNNLWVPKKIVSDLPGFGGNIQSLCLDSEEKYLYFRDSNAKFGRLELANPSNIELLNSDCGSTVMGTDNHLLYHPLYNCFFMSIEWGNGIYKISSDGKTVEEYAGFKGPTNVDGPVSEATFTSPMGMAVDSEGNIYVAQVRGHNIRKISYPDEVVTSIAGVYGQGGTIDGELESARLNGPWDITVDPDDNFYIDQFWGCSVRKLAIE